MDPELQQAVERMVAATEDSIPRNMAHVACLHRSILAIMAGQALGLKTRIHGGSALWRNEPGGHWGFVFNPSRLHNGPELPRFCDVPIHVWVSFPEYGMFFDPSAGTFPEAAKRDGCPWVTPPPPTYCWWKDGMQPPAAVYLPTVEASRFAAHHLYRMLGENPS